VAKERKTLVFPCGDRFGQNGTVRGGGARGATTRRNNSALKGAGLYREKLDAGLSPRTVQYVHVTLHKALKQAIADGLIPRNATEAFKPPQVSREEMRPLNSEQVKVLFEAAKGDRLEALCVLAVTTGLLDKGVDSRLFRGSTVLANERRRRPVRRAQTHGAPALA
jgi:hypothetical protein